MTVEEEPPCVCVSPCLLSCPPARASLLLLLTTEEQEVLVLRCGGGEQREALRGSFWAADVSGIALLPRQEQEQEQKQGQGPCEGTLVYSTLSGGVFEHPLRQSSRSSRSGSCDNTSLGGEGVRVVGLCADPTGVLLGSLQLLDTVHPDNASFRGRANRQRLRLHLPPGLKESFCGRGQQTEGERAMRGVLRRVLRATQGGVRSFCSLGGWLLLLARVLQLEQEEAADRSLVRDSEDDEGDDEGEVGQCAGRWQLCR
jgi:hypothetical protein